MGVCPLPKEGIYDKKKSEDLSEWYTQVIEAAGIVDRRYPIKGTHVWLPYGWKIVKLLDSIIRREIEATGHEEVQFPTLVPESYFKKEAEHIRGFEGQVFWITRAGYSELEERYLLRPTSESAMYPLFSLWIRTHKDLPLRIYQIVNVFRYETKQTRAFLRMREFHFFEAHTAHATYEESEKQIKSHLKVVERVIKDSLRLYYIASIRPEWDKFAGAYYSIGIDAIMPDGRTLQIATVHQYKDNFSRAYNITYKDEKGEEHYVHQTTFGMSERLVGAIVLAHGDDYGLILPPAVAPIQAVIVPITFKDVEESVLTEARKIYETLKNAGIRTHLDDRMDETPGSKFYYWELRGVPVRVEIGPKDIEKDQVVLVLRTTREKRCVPRSDLVNAVKTALREINDYLLKRHEEESKKVMYDVDSIEDAKKILEEKGRAVIITGWCGSEECADELMRVLDLKILGRDLYGRKKHKKCPICGRESLGDVYLAKTY
ncbi:MAG: proline--tRNA ligase [Euryarchaeota archaeon]|nr:proline--tRNA ligase [Euryarchaeota archaeon]